MPAIEGGELALAEALDDGKDRGVDEPEVLVGVRPVPIRPETSWPPRVP